MNSRSAVQPAIACSHRFFASGREVNHYCTYIKPQLLQAFPEVNTLDDVLLYSFFSSSILWFDLITSDIKAVLQIRNQRAGKDIKDRIITKRLRRANTCFELVLKQCRLINTQVARKPCHISYAITGAPVDIPSFRKVASLSDPLRDLVANIDEAFPVSLHGELSALALSAYRNILSVSEALVELLSAIGRRDPTLGSIRVEDFIDDGAILSPGRLSLTHHHPQALLEDTTHDELTFIKSHQALELWFHAVLRHINFVIDEWTQFSDPSLSTEPLIKRVAEMMKLFEDMIRMPQTMTAPDYLSFRRQLRAGSGAESIGFRLVELALGQRDPKLISYLKRMDLVTDEIERQLARPSLYEAFLSYMRGRGLTAADHDELVGKLASIMRPTGNANPDADIMWLAEEMIDIEQSLDRWRIAHLSMVDRMIGYRKSLGVGRDAASGTASDQSRVEAGAASDARPYLVRTLDYGRMFPVLWEARNLLIEQPSA